MAKTVIIKLIDIEWPNDMSDDEGPGLPESPIYATVENELYKLIRDGCAEKLFSMADKTDDIRMSSSWPKTIYEVSK